MKQGPTSKTHPSRMDLWMFSWPRSGAKKSKSYPVCLARTGDPEICLDNPLQSHALPAELTPVDILMQTKHIERQRMRRQTELEFCGESIR